MVINLIQSTDKCEYEALSQSDISLNKNCRANFTVKVALLWMMTTLIAICFVTVTNTSGSVYPAAIDTHHLRLGVIHHRQQVRSSVSFCRPAQTNRIS